MYEPLLNRLITIVDFIKVGKKDLHRHSCFNLWSGKVLIKKNVEPINEGISQVLYT